MAARLIEDLNMRKLLIITCLILLCCLSYSNAKMNPYIIGEQGVAAGALTISKITLYARVKILNAQEGSALRLRIKTEGSATDPSGYKTATTSYTDESNDWAVNPDDSQAWENTDLDDLQIGIEVADIDNEFRATQIYLVVTWSDETTDTYRPNGDFSDGFFVEQDEGTTLYQAIDEAVTDEDVTYIKTSNDWNGTFSHMEDP